ncbi:MULTISPECIES: NACHT domain-containing protein [Cyanophyceae]|uniref:NACHT domain-containing protein n=1 Tax=Cyanophyceae TaxID=3028117 RepID=UPI001686773C|nr:hypothetical protein [Trichocoleus sp. FACHB-40]MBD2006674.1 hypothetical protein [Trichocoleus sp. FACHB-40]
MSIEYHYLFTTTQLFNSHQVWLLLDGVYEIRADTSTGANSPLQGIANQLRGWVAQAQTLLTCRLNVWQANDRVVPNCDVYRTLDFDDPQVGEFIEEWFAKAGKPQLGKQLREKLEEAGRERIRDLIRNPLRLALLCQTWTVKQGELPKTKATLYQRFREDFYEWKKNEFPISWQQRQELNAGLGRLAVAAIEKQTQLRESLAYQVMGESLFELARQIGWLNLVYRDGETDEPVYAFYHLTFQEYFAALAIEDWHFFLTHDNDNPQPLPGNVYRIFEPQWKEVILLWLGRDKTEVLNEQKEQFILNLVEFDDGINSFYGIRAFFLAASGIAEFTGFVECSLPDAIVARVVNWAFGYFDFQTHGWCNKFPGIAEQSRAVLQQTDRSKVIDVLTKLLPPYIEHLTELSNIHQDNLVPKECILGYDGALLQFVVIVTLSLLKLDSENDYAKETMKYFMHIFEPIDWHIGDLKYMSDDFIPLIESASTYFGFNKEFGQSSNQKAHIGSKDTVESLIQQISDNQEENIISHNIWKLKELIEKQQNFSFEMVLKNTNKYLHYLDYEKQFPLYINCYEVIWHCAQNMTYPNFYRAWHNLTSAYPEILETTAVSSNSSTQSFDLANLPQLLNTAITNNSNLNDTIHLICIDSSKFENPDNPASEIYAEMVMQGCPERQNREPETMQALKVYCQLKCQGVFLIFYEDTSGEPSQGFSQTFLTSLSKFHNARRICVVSEQPCNLQTFSPSQPNLIADIVSWVREKIMEE